MVSSWVARASASSRNSAQSFEERTHRLHARSECLRSRYMNLKAVRRVGYAKALVRYFRDSQASFIGKLFVLLSVAYVVMPLDAIPDVAPVIGWLDDLGVVAVATLFLSRKLGKYRDGENAIELEPVPVPVRMATRAR